MEGSTPSIVLYGKSCLGLGGWIFSQSLLSVPLSSLNLQLLSLCPLGKESVEEQEEGLHLGVEGLLLVRIKRRAHLLLCGVGDTRHHVVELIAHGLGRDTSSSGLEVLTLAAYHELYLPLRSDPSDEQNLRRLELRGT
jgi:hypothetical protein